jgi:hypothetical protein
MANDNGKMQEALQQLILAQAAMTNTQTVFLERMAAIESDFQWIKSALVRHEEMLGKLPEAIRRQIGFQKNT